MTLKNTTPVQNDFFDKWMIDLSASAIRVYLKIIRNTYGWRDANGYPKQRDWISHSQFSNVGVSSRSVTTAVDELLSYGLITLTDDYGKPLHNPQLRKRAKRIYYAPISHNTENTTNNKAKTDKNKAQNLRTTKENFTKEYTENPNQRTPDHMRIKQILEQEREKQFKRDSWV